MKKIVIAFSLISLASTLFAGEPWAPILGYSSVNQKKTYNRFKFESLTGQYGDEDTYEHELLRMKRFTKNVRF